MALNFPNSGLYPGYQYTGDNGVIYIYDGVKWIGHAPNTSPGTNSITNGSNTVQVDGSGNLITPAYTFPGTTGTIGQILKWPASGTVLEWSNDNNSGGGGGNGYTGSAGTNGTNGYVGSAGTNGYVGSAGNDSTVPGYVGSQGGLGYTGSAGQNGADGGITDVVQDTSPQLGANLDVNGHWITGGSYDGNTLILPVGGGATLTSGYEGGVTLRASTNNTDFSSWNFTSDGNILLPTAAPGNSYTENKINAGGFGIPNSVQLRTVIGAEDGVGITGAEIALEAGNGGFSAQVYGPFTGGADGSGGPTLVYAGVENVSGANGPGFAGFVAIDPNVSNQYVFQADGQGGIRGNYSGASTTKYVASLGTLAGGDMGGNLFFNGISADNTQTTVAGDQGVLIGSNTSQGQQRLWTFAADGTTTVPGSINAQPGNDLDFGVYNLLGGGTTILFVNRDNTSGDKTTQFGIGPADIELTTDFKGTVSGAKRTWRFDNTGTIHLPVGGDIVDSNGVTVLGGGTTYDQSLNTNDNVRFATVAPDVLVQGASIKTQGTNRTTVLGSSSTVVFSAPTWMVSLKLLLSVEGRLDGDGTGTDHTQTAEATVAMSYNTNAEPVMSVYGLIYTSPTALATFTVRRTGIFGGGNIEIVAVNSQSTEALTVRVLATQFVSVYD